MNDRIVWWMMLPAFAVLMGCGGPGEGGSKTTPPEPLTSAQAATSESPGVMLDELDSRAPVPLLPMMANHQKENMRDHLVVVQEIVAALASNDFAAIERSAGRIGYSEQEGMMCEHMGAGATGFTEAGLKFHHTADSIAEAAKQKDAQGVLKALSATLETCTSCHSAFKQQVVDETTRAPLQYARRIPTRKKSSSASSPRACARSRVSPTSSRPRRPT